MEVIDKLVGWAVALSPLVGGAWAYFASRRKKRGSSNAGDDSQPVVQGQTVTVDHTTDFIDFLKKDHAELAAENVDLKSQLRKAHDELHRNNIKIPT